MEKYKFSVIIPAQKINPYLKENIKSLINGSYQDFEIIVLLDNKTKEIFPKTKIITTNKIGPAEKRDLGAKIAKG